MVANMAVEILKFLCFFVLGILIFVFMIQILYGEINTNFGTFLDTVKTMFANSLGGYSYDIFDEATYVDKRYGWALLTIFLFFLFVSLLNILVAILADIYGKLAEIKDALFRQGVILYDNVYGDSKYYSSIVCTWAPYNALITPLIPLVLLCRSSTLNTVVLFIEFIPILVLGLVFFILAATLLLPVAWVVLIIFSFKNLFHCKSRRSWCVRLFVFIGYLCFGPLLLLFYYFIDVVLFTKSIFEHNLKPIRGNIDTSKQINLMGYVIMKNTL